MENIMQEVLEPQEKATFVIQVECQDNATWQGTVTWTEENREVPFRSAMELLEIMNTVFEKDSSSQWESAQGSSF